MTARIGIALGDVTGIGPEVALKSLAAELPLDTTRFLLIGDAKHASELNHRLGLNLPLRSTHSSGSPQRDLPTELRFLENSDDRVGLYDPGEGPLAEGLAPGAAAAARASVAWVKAGAALCLGGVLDALVTAPVNKEAIVRSGIRFVGQTELLSELAGTDRTAMMLLGQDDRGRWLRVALATTHLPLKAVSDRLTSEKIEEVIILAAEACRDLGLTRVRIAVCGLNPHAGEGGRMGTEESTVIEPAVAAARRRGLDAVGPLSADALFYYAYRGDYDAVVAMYHDQGLAPLKMVAFERGVNWTLGLPFIRTSPDHGTAYDIAGQGKADPSSMRAAIQLAKVLAARKAERPTTHA